MVSKALQGIIPPMVTPLRDRDQLDHAGLERLVDHLVAGGVHALFVLGTTGEAPSLSYRLRRELVDFVANQLCARLPLLVGITDTSFIESVHLAEHAARSGASAVVLSTPYYFPAGQTELCTYVENLVAAVPLPVILYNIPSLTKVPFEIATLQRLAQHPSIIGVKDSSGDLDYFSQLPALRSERPDWFFLMGPEALLPEAMRCGGDGGVCGGANIYPELFVALYESLLAGNSQQTQRLHAVVLRLQHIYDVGKYASRFIKATKCALSLRNLCDDFLAEPFHRFHAPERERVAAILADVDLARAALETS